MIADAAGEEKEEEENEEKDETHESIGLKRWARKDGGGNLSSEVSELLKSNEASSSMRSPAARHSLLALSPVAANAAGTDGC